MKLRQEAPLGAVVAILACALVAFLPAEMSPDGWYALLGGDIVVHHGLPTHDWLTVWGNGREWVDQQWLAQLAYYGLYSLGGLRLALLANAAAVAATFGLAVALARARGGASRDVLYVAIPAAATIGLQSSALRPQTLVLPLFVAVTWLLAADARSPSRRVFATVPLLALWANLHGSATLGVGLVLLHVVLTLWARRNPLRYGSLGVLAIATLFATPYAAHVTGYYRTILFNGDFARYVPDWMPTSLAPATFPFYLLAVGVVLTIARAGKSLTRFERYALVALLVLAVEASRGITWFTLFALVIVPAALRSVRLPAVRVASARARAAIVATSAAAVVLAVGVAAAQPESWFASNYPREAARTVDAAAEASGKVFANGAYADWLLLVEPGLRGRIAYDARFELLPDGRLADAAAVSIGRWDAPAILRPYDVLVLRPEESELRAELTRSRGWRRVGGDRNVIVLRRTADGSA
jgi:hypothetical protein